MDALSTSPGTRRIVRHSRLVAAARMPLAGAWIALRFLLVPILWLHYRPGQRMHWAFAADAFMKRALYPLTETADDTPRNEANAPIAHIAPAASAPPAGTGWARMEPQPVDLAAAASGRPLLLILYRGSWCPYSRLHLADLATVVQPLHALGIAVLAVSARRHDRWWQARGIDLPFAADPEGELFRVMGVRVEPPLSHRVWGMLLPHESVFLFDRYGNLVAADVRRLDGMKAHQTFLRAARWLDHACTMAAPVARAADAHSAVP